MWDKLALILLIIGGINWGLVGIFQFDLVAWLFGGTDAIISRSNIYNSCNFSYMVYYSSFKNLTSWLLTKNLLKFLIKYRYKKNAALYQLSFETDVKRRRFFIVP